MQTVSEEFHDAEKGPLVPLDWRTRISFDKEYDEDIAWWIWDVSLWDGGDVWAPKDDNPLQQWDKYKYVDYSDRVVEMQWTREIEFPYSVQSAMGDVTLNNYDDYFTPNSDSPIADYVLPNRPIRLYAGYKNAEVVQQMVGLTQGMPEIDNGAKTAAFHVLDFLSDIFTLDLTDTLAMQNVTTDVVLAAIFDQFGILPEQYSLAKGRNKIPFLFIEAGTNAGEVLDQLMQAEMGKLWLDEQGIIRFDQRLKTAQDAVFVLDDSNIVSLTLTDKDNVINTVQITSNVREVQAFQPIFSTARAPGEPYTIPTGSDSGQFVVPAHGTAFYPNASLTDPALSAVEPTLGLATNVSWFTAVQADGTPVTSDVSIIFSQLHSSSYTMQFQNDNDFDVAIDQVEVWGEPAKVIDTINYNAFDEDSVAKYGTKILGGDQGISNDFFGSLDNCDSFATFVLDGYKDYAGVLEIECKGDYSLQLGDIVLVDYETFNANYQIIKIVDDIKNGTSTIQVQHYTPRPWWIWDVSLWDGGDVWAP